MLRPHTVDRVREPAGNVVRHNVGLADEEVVARQLDCCRVGVLGGRHDRLPVCGVVARAVHHLRRAVDRRQRHGGVQRRVDPCRRRERADGIDGPSGVGAATRLVCLARDEQRERAAEAEAEQPDTVVALARPVDGVAHVRPFPVPLVPVTVVETETVETACGQSVGDGPESFVPAVPAVLGVWRTRDHAGVGCSRVVVYTVQPPTNVASTRKKNVVGHTRVWDAIHRTLSPCANWVHGAVGARVKLTTMGILSRASYVVRSKINTLLNRAEDPSETLDYSYEQMRDELQEVKQGIADLTTQKKRLEMQKRNLEDNVEKHNEQAREAVEQDREDLARKALEKKKSKMSQIEELDGQIQELQNTQDQLVEKKNKLQSRIEEFKTKKETMKARYEAAEASNRVTEAMSGVGDEMNDVGRAIDRAEERTEEMEARSEAMDELQATGTFDDALSDGDEIDQELQQGRADREVETELETLKSDMGKAEADPEPDTGGGGDADLSELDEEAADAEVEAELEELKDDDDQSN